MDFKWTAKTSFSLAWSLMSSVIILALSYHCYIDLSSQPWMAWVVAPLIKYLKLSVWVPEVQLSVMLWWTNQLGTKFLLAEGAWKRSQIPMVGPNYRVQSSYWAEVGKAPAFRAPATHVYSRDVCDNRINKLFGCTNLRIAGIAFMIMCFC